MQQTLSVNEKFSFDGKPVRTLDVEGQPAWVAIDVARALGFADPDRAVRQHCAGRVNHPISSGGQMREVLVIHEPDLYRLIIKCKLPAAQRFEKWVFEEVLPAIRKTGGYSANNHSLAMGIPEAIVATGLELRRLADAQEEMNGRLDRLEKMQRDGIAEIKADNAMKSGRKEFSEAARQEFVACLKKFFSGRCPISGASLLDADGNVDWTVAHVDHWNGHADNSRNNGWVVSRDENMKMKDPAYRASKANSWLFWCDRMNPSKLAQLGFDFFQ